MLWSRQLARQRKQDLEERRATGPSIDLVLKRDSTSRWDRRSSTSSPRTCTRPTTSATLRRSACSGASSPYATPSSASSPSLRRSGSATWSTRIQGDSVCGRDAATVAMVRLRYVIVTRFASILFLRRASSISRELRGNKLPWRTQCAGLLFRFFISFLMFLYLHLCVLRTSVCWRTYHYLYIYSNLFMS